MDSNPKPIKWQPALPKILTIYKFSNFSSSKFSHMSGCLCFSCYLEPCPSAEDSIWSISLRWCCCLSLCNKVCYCVISRHANIQQDPQSSLHIRLPKNIYHAWSECDAFVSVCYILLLFYASTARGHSKNSLRSWPFWKMVSKHLSWKGCALSHS